MPSPVTLTVRVLVACENVAVTVWLVGQSILPKRKVQSEPEQSPLQPAKA